MKLIVALFNHYDDAMRAVERLVRAPQPVKAISVIVKHQTAAQHLARTEQRQDRGAISGGAHDNLNALLLGRMPIILPQVGSVIAAGPMASALRRSQLALKIVLQKAGLNERDAQAYRDGLRNGKVMVVIHEKADQRTETEFREILDEARGELIDEGNYSCS
jgi:hypothetical protein